MASTVFFSSLLAMLLISHSAANSVSGGTVSLEVVTGSDSQEYSTALLSEVKQNIPLTQSSKIKIQAKVSMRVGR